MADTPIPTSGPVSFSQLKSTFGVTNTSQSSISFSDFMTQSSLGNIGQNKNIASFRGKIIPTPQVSFTLPTSKQSSQYYQIDSSVSLGGAFRFRRDDTLALVSTNVSANANTLAGVTPTEFKINNTAMSGVTKSNNAVVITGSATFSGIASVPVSLTLRKRNGVVVSYSSSTTTYTQNNESVVFNLALSSHTANAYGTHHKNKTLSRHYNYTSEGSGDHSHCHATSGGRHIQYLPDHGQCKSTPTIHVPTFHASAGTVSHQVSLATVAYQDSTPGQHHSRRNRQSYGKHQGAHHYQNSGTSQAQHNDTYRENFPYHVNYNIINTSVQSSFSGSTLTASNFLAQASHVSGCINTFQDTGLENTIAKSTSCTSTWKLTVKPTWTSTTYQSNNKSLTI